MNRFHALAVVIAIIGLGLFAGYTALFLSLLSVTGFWSAALYGTGAAYLGSFVIPTMLSAWETGNVLRDVSDLSALLDATFGKQE